jgi:hypothetical protein
MTRRLWIKGEWREVTEAQWEAAFPPVDQEMAEYYEMMADRQAHQREPGTRRRENDY